MKALAGANPDAKPDYRSQALTELNKLEQKVILLNEMLDNVDTQRGEKFAAGDAYDVRFIFFEINCGMRLLIAITYSKYHRYSLLHARSCKNGYRMQKQMILSR